MGSSEFHVFRCNKSVNPYYLFSYLNRNRIRMEAEKHMTGASGHRRVPIAFYESLSIPLPPTETQERIVKTIQQYKEEITRLQEILNVYAQRKQAVLDKFLK
ncbi:MAG: restriction endonuclease subunit S [Planctomycetia bacterium]|nr:restriction endonuclease subunit S [Planctomycetia bacterium]